MNINTKVTSAVHKKGDYLTVDLFFNNPHVDRFIINIVKKEIMLEMHIDTIRALNIENTYEDYIKLATDLGYLNLEQPEKFKKHWTPNNNDTYYFVNRLGEVVLDTNIDSPVQVGTLENYNAFPTHILAEKSINLSKLGRLILLWQCTNNCIFEPNWEDENQYKYYIVYYNDRQKLDWHFDDSTNFNVQYFATKEQIEAFIEMYRTDIKKLMNIN